ncbi:hypothetical protein D3C83_66880 [compost metagenome]
MLESAQEAVGAQIRKAGNPGLLPIAHAGAVDCLVERSEPRRAIPHCDRLGSEMIAERPLERRASGERHNEQNAKQIHSGRNAGATLGQHPDRVAIGP